MYKVQWFCNVKWRTIAKYETEEEAKRAIIEQLEKQKNNQNGFQAKYRISAR